MGVLSYFSWIDLTSDWFIIMAGPAVIICLQTVSNLTDAVFTFSVQIWTFLVLFVHMYCLCYHSDINNDRIKHLASTISHSHACFNCFWNTQCFTIGNATFVSTIDCSLVTKTFLFSLPITGMLPHFHNLNYCSMRNSWPFLTMQMPYLPNQKYTLIFFITYCIHSLHNATFVSGKITGYFGGKVCLLWEDCNLRTTQRLLGQKQSIN